MKKINCNTSSELAGKLIECLSLVDNSYPTVCVFGHYEIIKQTLEDLIREGVSIGFGIELEDYESGHYDKEYVLCLCEDGASIEKKWHEENEYHGAKYYDSYCDIAFVHEDCNSKILKHIGADLMIEFSIDEDVGDYSFLEVDTEEGHQFVIKFKLDADDALKAIDDMEKRMSHMSEICNKIVDIQKLFNLY